MTFSRNPLVATELWEAIRRLSPPPGITKRVQRPSQPSLLSSRVLFAACGGDATILSKIRAALHARLPDDLAALEAAVQSGDAPRVRDRAHRLAGMVSAFSRPAGDLASEVAERAELADLSAVAELVETLRAMSQELLELTRELTLEDL